MSSRADTPAIAREAMTIGEDHGKTFPPKFMPKTSVDTAMTTNSDPALSKAFKLSITLWPDVSARRGPSVVGVVKTAITKIRKMKGTCIPKAHRHPILSHRAPPKAAPQADPAP